MLRTDSRDCPDCKRALSRRDFMRTAVGGVGGLAAASVLPLVCPVHGPVHAAPTPSSPSETLVAQLYKSLKDEQRKRSASPSTTRCARRSRTTGTSRARASARSSTPTSRPSSREIFMGIHSEEYAGEVMKQVEHDDKAEGGFRAAPIALFGEPGKPDDKVRVRPHRPALHPPLRRQQRRRRRPSAARSSTATPPRASTRSPTTPATSTGSRPSAPTRSSRPSTASSASSPSATDPRKEEGTEDGQAHRQARRPSPASP